MIFFNKNLQVFKKIFLPLFLVMIISGSLDQYLNMMLENTMNNPDAPQKSIYWLGILSLLSGIIFPVIMSVMALFALCQPSNQAQSFGSFFKHNLNQIFIESLRAWGKIILWSLFFVLPGIWKYLQYSLVPFVVTSSKEYEAGKADALETSASVVRQRWGQILGILFIFHLFIPLVISTFFDAYRLIWKTPITSIILSALDTYLLILSTHLLFNIFISEVRKNEQSHI